MTEESHMSECLYYSQQRAVHRSYILIIYVLVFGALYFFYLRPRSKKQKAAPHGAKEGRRGRACPDHRRLRGHGDQDHRRVHHVNDPSGAELDFIPSAIARRFDPVPVDEPTTTRSQEGDQQ